MKKSSAAKLTGKPRARKGVGLTYPAIAPIRDAQSLAHGVEILRARDPVIVDKMLALTGQPPLRLREPDLRGLLWIVMGQQVSVASANAIFGRFCAVYPQCDAARLAGASDAELRACGLSAPKLKTVRAIARAIVDGALEIHALAAMNIRQAHAALVAIHGIGPWTADLFLLSCLGHPDAWPAGDLALQEAARQVLNLRARPDAKTLEKIGERWRPARAVAARLLWAWYGAVKKVPT